MIDPKVKTDQYNSCLNSSKISPFFGFGVANQHVEKRVENATFEKNKIYSSRLETQRSLQTDQRCQFKDDQLRSNRVTALAQICNPKAVIPALELGSQLRFKSNSVLDFRLWAINFRVTNPRAPFDRENMPKYVYFECLRLCSDENSPAESSENPFWSRRSFPT